MHNVILLTGTNTFDQFEWVYDSRLLSKFLDLFWILLLAFTLVKSSGRSAD